MLLLLSPDYLESAFSDLEITTAAMNSHQSSFNLKIVPVILRDIDAGWSLPLLLKDYVCIDVQDENECCAKIIEAICHTGKPHYDIDRRLLTIVLLLLSLSLSFFSLFLDMQKKRKKGTAHARTHTLFIIQNNTKNIIKYITWNIQFQIMIDF